MSTDSSFDNVNPAETYLNIKTEATLSTIQTVLFRDGKIALVRDTGKMYRLKKNSGGDGIWQLVVAGSSDVAWSPSGNGNAETWADVQAMLANTNVPLTINLVDVDQTNTVYYDVPAGVTDLKQSVFIAQPGGSNQAILRLADGAQLRNGGFREFESGLFSGGMGALFQSTGGSPSPLDWDTSFSPSHFSAFGFGAGSAIQNTGTIPVISVPAAAPDALMIFSPINNGSIIPGTAPIISLGAGALLIIASLNNNLASLDPGWISAGVTNVIGILADGFDLSTTTTWVGAAGATILNDPITMDGGSGTTSLRPIGAIVPLVRGTRYWDIDLVPPRPIYWDGAAFVDALGIPV